MTTGRRVLGMIAAVAALVAGPAEATVRTVTDFGDSGASGQLRDLIAASSVSGGDVVRIPAGPPIVLTAGFLSVDRSLTIEGAGPGRTVIDGAGADRVFVITTQSPVTFRGLTIRNGQTSGSGGGIYVIFGVLTLGDAVVSGNRAEFGGGLFVSGRAVVEASTIHDNEALLGGGAYFDEQLGAVDLTNVTVSGNRARQSGGGLSVDGSASLRNVTITGNRADSGGPGGFGEGGGLYQTVGNTTTLHDTVIAGNTIGPIGVAPDCSGSVVSLGSNLVQDPTGCNGLRPGSDLTGLDPVLGPLADNGGPTPTHALLAGSPAIDAGNACPSADQRGVPRPRGSFCDIGAFERGPLPLAALDFDRDGVADIVVGAGRGDEPRVRVLSGVNGAEVLTFLAYDPSVRSGVRVAACDLTGDGVPDVVTAPGGPGPVRVFDGTTGQALTGALGSFTPVPAVARSVGVTLACVDISGDGVADVVVGVPGGPGVNAEVLTFSGVDASPLGTAPVPGLHGAVWVAP